MSEQRLNNSRNDLSSDTLKIEAVPSLSIYPYCEPEC